MSDTLCMEDLKNVFIRVGARNVDLYSATNQEFDDWAKRRSNIAGYDDGVWSLQERAEFCTYLWKQDALVMIGGPTG